MEFVSLDVETANEDLASVCQIGIARFANGALTDEWQTLIDPEDDFSPINSWIHGIDEEAVRGSPKFVDIVEYLIGFIGTATCVSHTPFDRVSLERVHHKYHLPPPPISWLDSARVVRRAWVDCAISGYGLADCCARIGYSFQHHDALEDAKAAGYVLLAAMRDTGLDIHAWKIRAAQPINPSKGRDIGRKGNPDGALVGEVIAFTGALSLVRAQAADLAAQLGCDVAQGVTTKLTMLVVGDQDIRTLAGHTKSAKHMKAERLITEGQNIRILQESDFLALIDGYRDP